MATQVELEPGIVSSRLHYSPLSDSSNKTLMEDSSIISSDPRKPTPGPKPIITPKPYAPQRHATIRPILAPKPKSESLSKPEPLSKLKPTSPSYKSGTTLTSGLGNKPEVPKPEPSSPLNNADQLKPAESGSVTRRTSFASQSKPAEWAPRSKTGGSITRAKSMGFLSSVVLEEVVGKEGGEVVRRPQETRSSRPRPVSAYFLPDSTESSTSAPPLQDRRPLLSDLTAKFELATQRQPTTGESKENTPETPAPEDGLRRREKDHIDFEKGFRKKDVEGQDAKRLERTGSGIKRRISLLLDSSASTLSVPATRGAEPRSPVPPIADTDGVVGVKQRIKELTEDFSSTPQKPPIKPRPLTTDRTKRFASDADTTNFSDLTSVHEGVDELDTKPKDFPSTGETKPQEDRALPAEASSGVQTVRASVFENVVEKHSVHMIEDANSSTVKPTPRRSLSLRTKETGLFGSMGDEDDISLVKATYQKVVSPTSPKRIDHVFDMVALVEESRAVSENIPGAHLEEKALTLRRSNAGERLQEPSMYDGVPENEQNRYTLGSGSLSKDNSKPSSGSATERSNTRYLRVGALAKWDETYVDGERDVEMEKQREMVRKVEEEIQRQTEIHVAVKADIEEDTFRQPKVLETTDQQMTKPRATYFALTGQMNETVHQRAGLDEEEMFSGTRRMADDRVKPEMAFEDFSVKEGRRGYPNRVPSIRRNPYQDPAFRQSSQKGLEIGEGSDATQWQRGQEKEKKQERLKLAEYEKWELERQRELEREKERQRKLERETERQSILEREKERQRELEREKERQRKLEREKERQRELERERERQRELEREKERQSVLEREKERQSVLEREKERQSVLEREKERQSVLEREKERQSVLEREKERQRELEREKERQRELERERERQRELEREKERQSVLEREKERQSELEREREGQRELEREKERQSVLEREKERQSVLEREKERQSVLEREKERQSVLEREKERQSVLEREKERQRELEREKERQRELERERERQRELERARERQRELERARERQRELERERERQRELERERERQRELEREKERQRERERERQRELERERERQRELERERERQRELERQREMERLKEIDRQMQLERERQIQIEYERRRAAERELEHQREAERLQKEVEREKERFLEEEKMKLREYEKQQEMEQERRQREIKRQKQRELERQKEQERQKVLERQKQLDEMERWMHSDRQKAQEREKQRMIEDLKKIQELEKRQLLEFQFQKEHEQENQVAKKKQEEGQREAGQEKRTAESPLRPKVLDLDNVSLGDRFGTSLSSDQSPTPRWIQPTNHDEEAYKPPILDVDSFRNQTQPGVSVDPFGMTAFASLDPVRAKPMTLTTGAKSVSPINPQSLLQNLQRDPPPQSQLQAPYQSALSEQTGLPLPLQPQVLKQPGLQAFATERPKPPTQTVTPDWTHREHQFDMFGMSQGEVAVDEPSWLSSTEISKRPIGARPSALDQILQRHEERITGPIFSSTSAPSLTPTLTAVQSSGFISPMVPVQMPTSSLPTSPGHILSLGGLFAGSRKKNQTALSPSVNEPIGSPSWEPASQEPNQAPQSRTGAQEQSRMRSRSVSQRPAPAETSVDGPLARIRSRSAHRDQRQDSLEQLKQSRQDQGKDPDTLVQETDSQYGTWDTDDSLTPVTPSSDSNLFPSPRKPSLPQTPDQLSPEEQKESLNFPQSSTTLLDSSAQRSKAQLNKSCRRRRAPPSRAARHSTFLPDELELGTDEWRFKDTTEDKPDSAKQQDDESDEEEPTRHSRTSASTPASLLPQRVLLFPGMDPSVLMAQLKKRGETDSQTDGPSPSQLSRSPKSPFLGRASRVLPPVGGKENGEESSPQWLKELKTKKRFSQIENDG